jgi:cytoskeleton protein RodZ
MMSAAEDGPDGPALGASRVGAELRAARQRLGWKLADVAATIRIRLPYLEAIEDGRLADLPGNAYAMGFLRSYATFLGLDAAEVARRFRAEASEVNRKPDLAFPAPVPERGVPAGAVVLMGVLIAVGAYAAWYKFSGDMPGQAPTIPSVPERLAPLAAVPPSNPSPQVASILPAPGASVGASSGASSGATPIAPPGAGAAPGPTSGSTPGPTSGATSGSTSGPTPVPVTAPPTAPPALPAADASRMVLRMKGDSWIQVREKNGPVLLNRVMRAGETWPVPKGQGLLLTTGNAGGTEVLLDGAPTASLGGAGAVRRDVPLDMDTVGKKPAP